jgi:hypothetical protein
VSGSSNYLLLILLAGYIFLMGWYVRTVIISGSDIPKKADEPYATTRRKRRKKGGKKCPECGKIVDRRRRVCQYCDHEFKVNDDVDLHPEEKLQLKYEQNKRRIANGYDDDDDFDDEDSFD